MQGRRSDYYHRVDHLFFLFFIFAKIGHMGKLILKVRSCQVHSSQGRRLDAGQAVRCWAGG